MNTTGTPAHPRPRAGIRFSATLAVVLTAICLLGACAADTDVRPSSTPPAAQAATPTPTPTLAPTAQAFGGDCSEALSDDEVAAAFGPLVALDPVSQARQRVAEEASILREGGIVCDWNFGQVRLSVVVLPVALVPAELHNSAPEEACVSGFTDCSWRTVSGRWWIEASEWPTSSPASWNENPERVESVSQTIGSRAQRWDPPRAVGMAAPFPECADLQAAVEAAVPTAGLEESGWGIAGVEAIALATHVVESCAWSNASGVISLRMQRDVGKPDDADLEILGAENHPLPNGAGAHLIMNTAEYGTMIASAGDDRVAITGNSVAKDPEGVAAILEAVIGAL